MVSRSSFLVLSLLVAWVAEPGSAALQSKESSSRRRDRRHLKSAAECDVLTDDFIREHSSMPKPTANSLQEMLYFLHIPRTAGRTYHACFLK